MKLAVTYCGLVALLAGCAVETEDMSNIRTHEQKIVNGRTTRGGVRASATVLVQMPQGNCSGTLIGEEYVLTAGHCVCVGEAIDATTVAPGDVRVSVWNQLTPATDEIAASGVWAASQIDTTYIGCETNSFEPSIMASDVAVIRLRRGELNNPAIDFPPAVGIAPMPVSLDHPDYVAEDEYRPAAWIVGFGRTVPYDVGGALNACLGCTTRRAASLYANFGLNESASLRLQVPYLDHFPEGVWEVGDLLVNDASGAHGDSGGPLFFNDPNGQPMVVGVYAHTRSDSSENFYASTGTTNTANFIWEKAGMGYLQSETEQFRTTAIYATETLRLNDRAHVSKSVGSPYSFTQVIVGDSSNTGSAGRLGVEAELKARFFVGGTLGVADRAYVSGPVVSSRAFPGDKTGGTPETGKYFRFRDIPLWEGLPAPSSGHTFVGDVPHHSDCDADGCYYSLAPGVYGSFTVRNGYQLRLESGGLYVFDDLWLESGSDLVTPTHERVWVAVQGELMLRGDVGTYASNLMMYRVPQAQPEWYQSHPTVFLGGNFRGTLVAPGAMIDANMVDGADIEGALFAASVQLHQGRHLFHMPFLDTWYPTCDSDFTNCE